jgi:hypothetical protein
MKNTSTNNNNPSHSLYIKLALFLGAIAFSLLHPLVIALLSVSYFFVSNLTVGEIAVLKQKTKEVISTAIEKQVQPRLSQYVAESKRLLPSSTSVKEENKELYLATSATVGVASFAEQDNINSAKESVELQPSVTETIKVDLPTRYRYLFGESYKFPQTKSCFTKQYNAGLKDVIALWDMKQREQFISEFSELISRKTEQRILSTSVKNLPTSKTPSISFPIKEIEALPTE